MYAREIAPPRLDRRCERRRSLRLDDFDEFKFRIARTSILFSCMRENRFFFWDARIISARAIFDQGLKKKKINYIYIS